MKKIVIGVPLVNKSLHPDFVKSLVGSVYFGANSDIEFFVDFESNSPYIDLNKNVIANRVMKSKTVDGVIFLSPNLSWKPETLESLVNHPEEVMSGVFPEPVTHEEVYDLKLKDDQDTFGSNLIAEYVNMNACYVSKDALIKASKYSLSSYDNEFYFFFNQEVKNGLYNPSFLAFCSALTQAGIDINVEKTANFGNIGEVEFDGNYEKSTQQKWVDDQAEMQDIERGLI